MKRIVLMTIGMIMAATLLAGCWNTEEGGTGTTGNGSTPNQSAPQVGDFGYDEHLCEFRYTGTGPRNGWEYATINGITYCYVRAGVNVYDAYSLATLMGNNWSTSGLQPTFRRDFSDGSGGMQFDTLVVMLYSDQLWRRVPAGTDAVEIYYNNAWVTWNDYNLLEQQRLASESEAVQQAQEEARQRGATQLAQVHERIVEMSMVSMQPACNFSYNGCA